MTGVRVSVLAVLAAAMLFVVGSAGATTGTLDPSFGVQGTVTTWLVGPEGVSPAFALLLQPDGKIVTIGAATASPEDVPAPDAVPTIALVRYKPDGSQDPDFGSDGVVQTTTDGYAIATAGVLQPDGKIVVAGWYQQTETGSKTPQQFLLVRYNANGSLDPTFGTGGIVTTPVGDGDSEAFGLVLQPDGKLVAGGQATGSAGSSSALVRYLPNGSLDTSFGTNGIVLDSQTGENGFAGIALQPNGKILGVGQGSSSLGWNYFATTPLTRFNSDGTLDSSFGSGGVSDVPTGQAAALTLQPDGKIVVVGRKSNSFQVSRVDPDGTADPSFGSGGTVVTPMGSGISYPAAVTLQSDAKIVVAGESQGGFTVARYNPDGSLDTSFGSGGIATTLSTDGPPWTDAAANSVVVQPDGKIVAAGSSSWSGETGGQLALARYYGSQESLTITKSGTGSGKVTSNPAGINCGTACSHAYDGYEGGASIRLTATPARGSSFTSWSGGGCSGTGTCSVTMTDAQTVTATFTLKPACIAPKTKGKSLTAARRLIKRAHCRTGAIKHSFSRVKKGHVISQSPGRGKQLRNGARIALVVSKGRRP